jgi:hypothetical protein
MARPERFERPPPRFLVKLCNHLQLDHSSYLFAGARQSFRAQVKTSLLLARLCIVTEVSGGSRKDRKCLPPFVQSGSHGRLAT